MNEVNGGERHKPSLANANGHPHFRSGRTRTRARQFDGRGSNQHGEGTLPTQSYANAVPPDIETAGLRRQSASATASGNHQGKHLPAIHPPAKPTRVTIMARPSTHSPEIVEAVCARLEDGDALAEICRTQGMPKVRTWLDWAARYENVAKAYSVALQARAEFFEAEHTRISKTAVDRDTAAGARVQLAALEWRMAKLAPSRYGDRIDVNVDHTFDLAATLDKGRQRVLDANQRLGLPEPDGGAK